MTKLFGESYNWWNPWHWKKIRLYNQSCKKYREEIDGFLIKNNCKSLWELESRVENKDE
jgi:hypothetical protein